MNREELIAKAKEMGISEKWYSLTGDPRAIGSIFEQVDDKTWRVFNRNERGGVDRLKHFKDEGAALDYLLELFQPNYRILNINKK